MPGAMKAGWLGRRTIFLRLFGTALAGARMVPAFAALGDDAGSAVSASDEPHHHVILKNGLVRMFRVLIPPGRSTLWHEHNFDFVVLAVNGRSSKLSSHNSASNCRNNGNEIIDLY